MLRFNFYVPLQKQRFFKISIHPMLRFNGSAIGGFILKLILFQYILCYGSTLFWLGIRTGILCYFNTSYVTVQQNWVSVSGKTIKHFNTSYVTVQQMQHWQFLTLLIKFQYILCYGSTFSLGVVISFVM